MREISVKQVRQLARLQCTETEAAAAVGVSVAWFKRLITHNPSLRRAWTQGREQGKVRLRAAQMDMAMYRPDMAKWLGRQYLGQQDTVIMQHSGPDGAPIQTMDLGKLDAEQRQELRKLLLASRVNKSERGSNDAEE